MNLTSICVVGFAAAIGGIVRFLISTGIKTETGKFPLATCMINLIGSLLIGLILNYTLKHEINQHVKLFLTVGFCGGFTTFSTFSMETVQLLQNGNTYLAFLYIIISVAGGMGLAWLGLKL